MTVRVILDVASYQGPTPDLTGASGLMIKAVEGEWPNTNPYLDAQVDWAIKHGLPYGFYDFWHPMFAGTSDMQLFIQKIHGYNPTLGAAVDAEVNDNLDGGTVLARLLEDLHFVFANYPFRTWLYTADWWLTPNTYGQQKQDLAQLAALWVAGYLDHLPTIPYPFQNALMWQFTDSWQGRAHQQDASYFLGSDDQWNFLCGNYHPLPSTLTVKTKLVQKAVGAVVDGVFGRDTHNRVFWVANMRDAAHRMDPNSVKLAQMVAGIPQTGKFDTLTHDRVGLVIQNIQKAMGVTPVDGTWSQRTAFAEAVLDPFV